MGDERRSEKLKEEPVGDEPVKAKRTTDQEPDAAHADRQIEMRGRTSGKVERAGFVENEKVDHTFEGTGDQSAASAEMSRILDAGVPVAGLVTKVQNLDHLRREDVAKRIADVAKVTSGNEVLQIADLVGLPVAAKLRAALSSATGPTANAVRAHLMDVPIDERIKLLDAPMRALLEAKYSGPSEIVPGITEFGPEVRKHPDLVAWFLRTTPASAAALSIIRWSALHGDAEQDELAAIFNNLGADGWRWAASLDAATAQMWWSGTAGRWATLTKQDAVRAHLEAIAPKTPNQAGRPPSVRELQELVPDGNIDVPGLIAALQEARTHAGYLKNVQALGKPPYRERLIASASLEQLELIFGVLSYTGNEELAWLLDSPHASPETLRPMLTRWGADTVAGVADQPKLVTKFLARFPAAGPTDFFGGLAHQLYPAALRNATVRKWCTVNADPRDLLMLVTQQTSSIAKMWTGILSDGVPADWYKNLGTGVGASNDERLRKLALNTPDHQASAWIRHTLIGDYDEGKTTNDPVAIPDIAYERDARKRFQQGLDADQTRDMGQRTAELSDQEIAALRSNPEELAALLPKLQGEWLLHELLRIKPPLPIVLRYADLWNESLAGYIRTRPASETTDAFAHDATEKRVVSVIKTPFETFPALREPAVLASVLSRGTTLTWLLKHADVPYVMSLFANQVAGKAAAKIFTKEHVKLVPDLLHRKEDRAAVSTFAHFLHGALEDAMLEKAEDPAEIVEEDEDSEPSAPVKATRGSFEQVDIQARQDELEAALALGDLVKGLEMVLGDKEHVSVQNVLAVCRERGAGGAKLVGKPEHEATVEKLRTTVRVSPLALFPDLAYHAYFHTATSRQWLFQHEDAMLILREVSNDPQLLKLIVDKLEPSGGAVGKDTSIDIWLDRMPKGTALSAGERILVKRMFEQAHTPIAARKLFEIRFGTRMTKSFTREELASLWATLERLPDAHIEMGSVQNFYESKDLGYAGVYGGQQIGLEEGLIDKGPGKMFDQENEMTREQLVAAYGYNDHQIKAKVAQGHIEERKTAKGMRYVIKPVPTNELDTTVLHEVGHAVDDMLGDKNELVYGLAGWHAYGESDIDELARELGGWDRVRPDDQERIKDAWAVWLNSRSTDGIDKFVPDSHPALADKYKGVGIVDLARKKESPDLEHGLFKGKFTIAHQKYQRVYRVPDKTRNAAPTRYAMTAPQEWFAECYSEYYREYRGPGTEDKKGGRLAGWIKGWFDQNIDTLQYNPERVDGKNRG